MITVSYHIICLIFVSSVIIGMLFGGILITLIKNKAIGKILFFYELRFRMFFAAHQVEMATMQAQKILKTYSKDEIITPEGKEKIINIIQKEVVDPMKDISIEIKNPKEFIKKIKEELRV